MNTHLTLDEMVAFLDTSKIDDDTKKQAFRINEHLNSCTECYHIYKSLVELEEQINLLKDKPYCSIKRDD